MSTTRTPPDQHQAAGGVVMTEAAWTTWVIDLARWHGWHVSHFRPARTAAGWRTAVQGHPGFPDLVLARAGLVLFRELKTDRGVVTAEQRAWLAAIGDHADVWRPRDRDLVIDTLAGGS
ncbi:MAG: VRR-NUC domain-containing protein [Phycicoccus sp.]